MALLDVLHIEPELDEPGFWTQHKLGILNFLKNRYGTSRRISKKDHNALTLFLNSNHKPSNKQFKDANAVMARLEGLEWNVRFLSIKQKRPRPSALPATPSELKAYNAAVSLRNNFWGGESTKETANSETLLFEILTIEAAMTLGLPPKKLADVISNMLVNPIRTSVPVSISADMSSSQKCSLPCAARFRLLSSLFVNKYGALSNIEVIERVALIEKSTHLNVIYKHLCLAGIEPIIAAQLYDLNLPVNTPPDEDVFQFTAQANTQYPRIFIRPQREVTQSQLMVWSSEAKGISDNEFKLPLTEAAISSLKRAWQIIKQGLKIKGVYKNTTVNEDLFYKAFSDLKASFIYKLREAVTNSGLNKDKLKKSVEYINYLEDEAITPIDLAYAWAEEQLLIRKNTADTLASYFNHVFNQGFMHYTDCFSLALWEDEDTEAFVCDYILSKRASVNTSNQVLSEYSAVIDYAQTRLKILDGVNLNHLKENGVVLTTRTRVLGLLEFDTLIKQTFCHDDATEKHKAQRVCFLELAFYGGLRRHEIENLTPRDIVYNEHETLIYIRKSKSQAGIRVVPYHLLAPPYAVTRIQDFIDEKCIQHRINVRKAEATLTKFRFFDELLFSVGSVPGINNTAILRDECIKLLQIYAGPGADLHLLRHSRGSHLFLWWYSARYTDLIPQLADANHWNYSAEGLRAIRNFFIANGDEPLSCMHTTAMIHIIKTFGHSDTNTFFKVYIHCFDVIASHSLKRAHSNDDSFLLKGKVIEQLLPKARSRSTQAKITDKTIASLARYAFKNITKE